MTHFLNSRFAFFYLRRDRSQKETDAQGYQNAVQKIGSFDSVEGFFGIYDHLVKPHSLTSETHVTDYHLFREGISPTWEDAKNRNGGKWIVRLRKVEGLASLYWEDLIMALVGEQFGDVGCQVCGVVVSVRQHEDILSVWTQDSKDAHLAASAARFYNYATTDIHTCITLPAALDETLAEAIAGEGEMGEDEAALSQCLEDNTGAYSKACVDNVAARTAEDKACATKRLGWEAEQIHI